jgi:cytochrome P450
VIYEGLRMRPPVPIKFHKVVPPQGDEIDGKAIPGGTAIGWNLIPMMRSTRHWGQDAEVFRPERFVEADEDTRLSMERLVDMVFGYGRFACAGRPLAFMELIKVYFEVSTRLIQNSAWELCQCRADWLSVAFPPL